VEWDHQPEPIGIFVDTETEKEFELLFPRSVMAAFGGSDGFTGEHPDIAAAICLEFWMVVQLRPNGNGNSIVEFCCDF